MGLLSSATGKEDRKVAFIGNRDDPLAGAWIERVDWQDPAAGQSERDDEPPDHLARTMSCHHKGSLRGGRRDHAKR
jgi:hypothetical protein